MPACSGTCWQVPGCSGHASSMRLKAARANRRCHQSMPGSSCSRHSNAATRRVVATICAAAFTAAAGVPVAACAAVAAAAPLASLNTPQAARLPPRIPLEPCLLLLLLLLASPRLLQEPGSPETAATSQTGPVSPFTQAASALLPQPPPRPPPSSRLLLVLTLPAPVLLGTPFARSPTDGFASSGAAPSTSAPSTACSANVTTARHNPPAASLGRKCHWRPRV